MVHLMPVVRETVVGGQDALALALVSRWSSKGIRGEGFRLLTGQQNETDGRRQQPRTTPYLERPGR
jgi:hypothetical protein